MEAAKGDSFQGGQEKNSEFEGGSNGGGIGGEKGNFTQMVEFEGASRSTIRNSPEGLQGEESQSLTKKVWKKEVETLRCCRKKGTYEGKIHFLGKKISGSSSYGVFTSKKKKKDKLFVVSPGEKN